MRSLGAEESLSDGVWALGLHPQATPDLSGLVMITPLLLEPFFSEGFEETLLA